MSRFWLIPIACVALLVPAVVLAGGGQSGFDGVVSTIESRYHAHATRIPFLGLVSLASREATKGGVAGLHVAEFDSIQGPVDGTELNRMVEEKLGSGWDRIIRETSKKGSEQTLIFIHPEGDRMAIFVLDYDGNELNVVQVSVDPNHLNDELGHLGRSRRHDRADAAEAPHPQSD